MFFVKYARQNLESNKTYRWQDINPLSSPEERALEIRLSWQENTLAVLRVAFEKKLARSTRWDIGGLSHPEAFYNAAKYYRRGVSCTQHEANKSSIPSQSPYFIKDKPDEDFLKLLQGHFVLCDENVLRHWPHYLDKKVDFVIKSPTEARKNLSSVADILQAASQFMWKPWLIIGGGICTDIGAFAADLSSRPFNLMPTTLLSMVDASLGGKTGVNFPPFGKNLIGSFAFPQSIHIYTKFLESLPPEEYNSGASECMKHSILKGDPDKFTNLCQAFANKKETLILQYLPSLLQIKADIVSRDPLETGERAILNLGHSTAHALEALSLENQSKNPLRHGEAVCIGLALESFLSVHLGFRNIDDHRFLLNNLKISGCLSTNSTLENKLNESLYSPKLLERIKHYLLQDKKSKDSSQIPFVLLGNSFKIHKPDFDQWVTHVDWEEYNKAWKEFFNQIS